MKEFYKLNIKINQNHEVIKIFIESYLVKNQQFVFKGNCLYHEKMKLIFLLEYNSLVLKDFNEDKILINMNIQEDILSENCVKFAINAYREILEAIKKGKL